jgi:hypothetical protein
MEEMTNKQKCLHMWDWIADQANRATKQDYFNSEHFKKTRWSEVLCYACVGCNDCENCPVKWGNIDELCLSEKSPYLIWANWKTQENAIKVRDCILNTWKE